MKEFVIKVLTDEYADRYEKYVSNKKDSLMYWSLKYRGILTDFLGDESEYLIAVDADDDVIGCLPIFYRKDNDFGIVANSLPYYGSHGGILADDDRVRNCLLDEYVNRMHAQSCAASTIVGSPLTDYDGLYKEKLKPTYIDERIELMTYFPYDNDLDVDEALMAKYHYKVRNMIRKAIKNGVDVKLDHSMEAVEFLYNTHKENMLAVGGLPKEKRFFEMINTHYKAGLDYNLYVAYMQGVKIAAMLVFYFNGTVEYYTPAIVSEYRNYQPLSLLIYIAMQDAMKKGMEKWNWGGTGLTQTSLYTFKSRWGTTETRYYYYTKIWDKDILKVEQKDILKKFSNYYVYPFNQVNVDK
ncbi:MAG: GNAT family N-acetyltransferase [Lachnospiraceae bacterium]|nr:GNAT family N-acetyltransferase [Lachnospiraceae bacterium]